MNRVAILGPGLLGGSISLALRAQSGTEVRLWARRPEAVEEAQQLGVAHLATTDLSEAVSGADTVLLCVPVGAMEALVQKMLPSLAVDALVTDVGSVKEPVCRVLSPLLQGRAHFIGSHPMAGSEKAGLAAARANLFEGAVCILTPESGVTSEETVGRATSLWQRLGGMVRSLPASVHDQICAMISHMPHLAAAALVRTVDSTCPEAFAFCGPGFRDTTRIAGGLPEMWTEILLSNRQAVAGGVRALISVLEQAAVQLERGDETAETSVRQLLESAKIRRDRLHCSGS